jgi:uroporphyrinogen decarboxylase
VDAEMSTQRERFDAAIHFRKPDVMPWVETFWDETVIQWLKQGLPADRVTVLEWEMGRGGTLLGNMPAVRGFNVNSYFGCHRLFGCLMQADIGPMPRYKLQLLNETDRYAEFLTETGAKARRSKTGEYDWYSMPMFIDFPVKNRETWHEYRKRLDPHDPRRYPKDWDAEAYVRTFETYQDGPTMIRFNGFYGFGAQLMGIPTFNVMFYKDPELMHDMIEYWEYFTIETIRLAVETLRDRVDLAFWWEDMSDRHGPCVSPRIFKEFFLPHYKRVTGFLAHHGIDRVLMDTDGNIKPLLDLLIEAGINGQWPLEVNSGMNAVELRKKYGERLFLVGNLDKVELAKGGQSMRNEVDSKVPVLKEIGGYLPGADHLIPVEFTLERFKEYADYIKRYLLY